MILQKLETAHIFRCGKFPQGLWFESNSGRFKIELTIDEAKELAVEIMTLAREIAHELD